MNDKEYHIYSIKTSQGVLFGSATSQEVNHTLYKPIILLLHFIHPTNINFLLGLPFLHFFLAYFPYIILLSRILFCSFKITFFLYFYFLFISLLLFFLFIVKETVLLFSFLFLNKEKRKRNFLFIFRESYETFCNRRLFKK